MGPGMSTPAALMIYAKRKRTPYPANVHKMVATALTVFQAEHFVSVGPQKLRKEAQKTSV